MYADMEWWTKIRLEVLREESSKREILKREGLYHTKVSQSPQSTEIARTLLLVWAGLIFLIKGLLFLSLMVP